jgi:DNA-binding beta-propeller fold protein YncE
MGKGIVGLAALLIAIWVGSAPAEAERTLITKTAVETTFCKNCPQPSEGQTLSPVPPPEGQIEGPCGIAISPPQNSLYIADYYHRRVYSYSLGGNFGSQILLPGTNPVFGVNTLDAVCQLAVDLAGNLYANEWHQKVLRLKPTEQVFDSDESTGVAVDEAGNVYANDRTYVAVYDSSGAPLLDEGEPLRIGLGSLGDAYGLAVAAGRVYVPDAADDTVKVYEPTVDPLDPVLTIDGSTTPRGEFVSLVDTAVAVDPTNGHLLVADNIKPGFEHPEAAIYEFDSSGAFLDTVAGAPGTKSGPIHGEPPGMAVNPADGRLYVSDGNSELSNVFAYGPYADSGSLLAPPSGEAPGLPSGSAAAQGSPAAAGPATTGGRQRAAASVVVQRGRVRVSVDGKLTPHALPRNGVAPVGISVGARIDSTDEGIPPQLRKIAIAINRNGRFTSRGLDACELRDIQPSTTAGALAACRGALVGEGRFAANVKLPEQSPFPSRGKVLAFNGRFDGRAAILAHIYGAEPAPTSYVLPFTVRDSRGTFGTVLEASLPQVTGEWGYVTGLAMKLRRLFSYRGKGRSYLNAGCPAPAGFPSAVFPLARTSFTFAGGMTLASVLNRTCRAKG